MPGLTEPPMMTCIRIDGERKTVLPKQCWCLGRRGIPTVSHPMERTRLDHSFPNHIRWHFSTDGLFPSSCRDSLIAINVRPQPPEAVLCTVNSNQRHRDTPVVHPARKYAPNIGGRNVTHDASSIVLGSSTYPSSLIPVPDRGSSWSAACAGGW